MINLTGFLLCISTISIVILVTCFNAAASTKPATSSKNSFTAYVRDPKRFAAIQLKISDFVFCDVSLAFPIRAKDLIYRMTLDEKLRQLGDLAYVVPRLGLHVYGGVLRHFAACPILVARKTLLLAHVSTN